MYADLMYGPYEERIDEVKHNSVDLILADIPFGTTQCKWDTVLDLDLLWKNYRRIMKQRCPVLLFAQSPFDKVLGCSNLPMFRYEWIWEKTNATGHLNAKKIPMKAHENILVFYNNLPTYNPQKTFDHKRKQGFKKKHIQSECYGKNTADYNYDSTERYPRSVQVFASDKQKSKLHSTQKPLALIEYLIKTYSNEGDTVLDNCMGSGTTGVGCTNLNRNFIGMEKYQGIFNNARDRIIKNMTEVNSIHGDNSVQGDI